MHDILRYANCWEDANVLLKGLSLTDNAKILSVASAGDNSFSLLTTNPQKVVCMDINHIQLYLVALKQACFRVLSYQEILEFLGFLPSKNRILVLEKLKNAFSYPNAYEYWTKNLDLIQKGVIYQGKFERYFHLFSHKILPFVHNKTKIQRLLAKKEELQQQIFYNQKWNTWAWRLMFKIFFSKFIMEKYGRDKSFFDHVKIPVSQYIYQKSAKHLQSIYAQSNEMLHFALLGHFGELLPHYLQPQNFDIIQKNINKITLQQGKVEDAIPLFGKFDAFNLSNIFEYMPKDVFAHTTQQLVIGAENNAKFAYWNLMVSRIMSSILPQKLSFQQDICQELAPQDKGFFYNQFVVDYL